MITYQQFTIMKESARCLIQIVFEYEDEFKAEFITPQCNYSEDEYTLDRVHLSGFNLRVQLRFEDNEVVDVYRDLTEVIEWYYDLSKKVLNKEN